MLVRNSSFIFALVEKWGDTSKSVIGNMENKERQDQRIMSQRQNLTTDPTLRSSRQIYLLIDLYDLHLAI